MGPEVDEGDYLGDFAKEEDDLGVPIGLGAGGPVARRLRFLIKKFTPFSVRSLTTKVVLVNQYDPDCPDSMS